MFSIACHGSNTTLLGITCQGKTSLDTIKQLWNPITKPIPPGLTPTRGAHPQNRLESRALLGITNFHE